MTELRKSSQQRREKDRAPVISAQLIADWVNDTSDELDTEGRVADAQLIANPDLREDPTMQIELARIAARKKLISDLIGVLHVASIDDELLITPEHIITEQ